MSASDVVGFNSLGFLMSYPQLSLSLLFVAQRLFMLMCGVSSVPPSGLSVRVYVYPHSTSTAGQCTVRVGRHLTALPVHCDHGAWCSIAQRRQTLERPHALCRPANLQPGARCQPHTA
jgi:hypothetical protein